LRDRYLAIEPIGQGGFGRTFKAIDEDKPSKPFCVIKQFFPQIKDSSAAQKAAELFTQEASALEQLDHRHIPKLLAYFITPDGRQYLVQEFIDGQNLKTELETNGLFSVAKVRELLTTLLRILDYIHRLGFIHRDIKPENIIRRADNQQLYLVDFGAAKVTTSERSKLGGTTIGTPEFMAPEQSWGGAFPASDLYSLGVTCLHLLTGVSPFTLFDEHRGEWMWRDRISQEIEPQLAAVLDKLIQSRPIDRYASAADAIADLTSDRSQQPVANIVNNSIANSSDITKLSVQATPPTPPSSGMVIDRESKCIYTFIWHNKPINAIAIFTNGEYLISGDDGGTVAIWNLSMPQQPIATYRVNNAVCAVAASPNYSQIASGDKNRKVQIRRKESIGNSLQFSPDGKILASAGADRRIRLWNTETSKIIYTFDGHQDGVTSIQFMPNGKILLSTGADRTIRFWDVEQKQLLKTIDSFHDRQINALAISRDGKIIVSGSADRTIEIRQLGTSTYQKLVGHQNAVLTVAISPDGKTIASGSIDGMVNLWDTNTQQLRASFQAHRDAVNSIVFHPIDRTLISASADRSIKIWQYPP
jgi:serine/threonine protein kinase